MAGQPWYTYPRIDNFGFIDPEGNYYKPDTNVLTPYGYPITSISTGVVTDVRRTSYGQTMVTVRLFNPLNPKATHMFFEHMHDATVSVGQVVQPGTLIGHANLQGEGANLGFGLYSGDVYGSGQAWNILQSDLCPGCPGMLNPAPLLDALKSGLPLPSSLSGIGIGGGGIISDTSNGIISFFSQVGKKIGWFFMGLMLLIAGFYLLFTKQTNDFVKNTAKVALLA